MGLENENMDVVSVEEETSVADDSSFELAETVNDKEEKSKKLFSKIDAIVFMVVAFLTLATYFMDWYGFFLPEGATFPFSVSFGPGGSYGVYGGQQLDIGLISPLFVWANVLIYVCEALLVGVIIVGAIPSLRQTAASSVIKYAYFGVNLVAVALGFIGAVGGVDPVMKAQTTVNIGWYAALVFSLTGLLLTAVPDLTSRILKSYKR